MTIEERREKLKALNGAAVNTFGWLDLIQNPEPRQEVDRDTAVVKAHTCAERALKLAQELLNDAWEERSKH